MTAIILPKDLEAWAEAEVDAGRAQSVEHVVAKALASYRQLLEDFRQSLDDAEKEAEELGWLELDEVFDRLDERIDAREAFEQDWAKRPKARLKGYKLGFTPQVFKDLDAIAERIAEDAGSAAAKRWSSRLRQQAAGLKTCRTAVHLVRNGVS